MMRILFFAILVITFSVACNRSQKANTLTSSSTDTIVLKDNEVVFICPSEEIIKELKQKLGEDFYTMADDANAYFAEASTYLDSIKVSYKNYDDSKTIVYKKNNKMVEIPSHTSPWYVIFFNNGRYKTLDLINLKEEYSKFFTGKAPMARTGLDAKHITDSVAGNKYLIVEEKECDLNSDTFKDRIVVFGNNNDANAQDPTTKTTPVAVLMNDHDQKYTVWTNENIYPNNFGDAFKRLVVKDSYFTIELLNEVPDQYVSEKYITFKFDRPSKEIVLSRYGEIVNWNDGQRTETLCSDKDFGRILFQTYDSNTIKAQCKK